MKHSKIVCLFYKVYVLIGVKPWQEPVMIYLEI